MPQEPHSALLLIHGFAEHSGRYEDFGSWFAARGYAVHALDHRGHGRSGGRRNYVARFDDFLDDVAAFEVQVRLELPDFPIAMVGHSMGGLISASYARARSPQLAGLALSGAALTPLRLSGIQKLGMGVMRRLASKRTMSSGLDPSALSRDPEVGRLYLEDPLIDTRITISLASEMNRAGEAIVGRGGEIEMPLLLMHGAADPICSPAGSEAFFASRSAGARKHATLPPDVWSRLRLYPELRHEIFNEPERETVFRDLLDWLSLLRHEA
jgi:alpha-beta hydrolase superfamily lysophospholipase